MSKDTNYIVEYNGEPVTRLSFDSTGKADLSTGDMIDAIWYTVDEAIECAAAIGQGAEVTKARDAMAFAKNTSTTSPASNRKTKHHAS